MPMSILYAHDREGVAFNCNSACRYNVLAEVQWRSTLDSCQLIYL